MRKKIFLIQFLALYSLFLNSQSLGTYTFPTTQVSGTSFFPLTYNGTDIGNLTEGNFNLAGVTYSNSSNNARATNWPTGATTGSNVFTGTIDLNKYFEFTLTANQGFFIHNPGLEFGIGRSGTGPRQFEWRSSIDNFTTAIPVGTVNAGLTHSSGILTIPDNTTPYTGNSFTINQTGLTSITFRFYAYNSEATGGTGGIQGPLTFSVVVNTSLPVNLLFLRTTSIGKFNVINWSTGTELNNSGFEIQRSTDGSNFDKIGFVKSLSPTGNSSSRLDYSFTDYNPVGLNQYYRLKQIDIDGAHKYSAIVLVTREAPTSLELTRVYPNPTQESVYINAAAHKKMELQLFLYDFGGRVVGKKQVVAQIGNNGFDMPVAHLAPGTYFIKVVNSEQEIVATQKFIKQ